MDIFDVVIIGGGPIGMACGIEASKAGINYKIIEKGALVNSIFNYPLNMTFFSTSEKLEIGDVPFISHLPKPNRTEALEYYRRVAMHWKLNIALYEKVEAVKQQDEIFLITTSKNEYATKAIVIATGFYDIPNLMHVKGEDLPKVMHYYKEAHPFFGQKIIVVGNANSAVDVALESYRKGADVTMVMLENAVSERVKYWVRPDIENRIKEGIIKAYFKSKITEIREKEVDIETPQDKLTLENDFVLAMTGYLPNFSFMEKLGIKFKNDEHKTPEYNPETMESNIKNIFLAGVVCGGYNTHVWFIENSRKHAEIIINHLQNK